jgi:hypothetical protein
MMIHVSTAAARAPAASLRGGASATLAPTAPTSKAARTRGQGKCGSERETCPATGPVRNGFPWCPPCPCCSARSRADSRSAVRILRKDLRARLGVRSAGRPCCSRAIRDGQRRSTAENRGASGAQARGRVPRWITAFRTGYAGSIPVARSTGSTSVNDSCFRSRGRPPSSFVPPACPSDLGATYAQATSFGPPTRE